MPAYKDRIDRLAALIPRTMREQDCPDPTRLLVMGASLYEHCATPEARRRAIQRDLQILIDEQRIEVINPGGKPLRYRRAHENADADPYLWSYMRRTIESILQTEWPNGALETIWKRVLNPDDGIELGDEKLRVISDSQRLIPAAICPGVLADVLEAVARMQTLEIAYRDAANKVTHPVIHPQALLQRGPRLYVFALKNDEEDVRMYALHRITSSSLGNEPARRATDFDLEQKINSGGADFGSGQSVELLLRARGYVADLLRECALSVDQRIEDEVEGSDFDVRVRATVPATGQLLRWLLGCGDKVELVAPEDLRKVVASQTAKASHLYGTSEQAGSANSAESSKPHKN